MSRLLGSFAEGGEEYERLRSVSVRPIPNMMRPSSGVMRPAPPETGPAKAYPMTPASRTSSGNRVTAR